MTIFSTSGQAKEASIMSKKLGNEEIVVQADRQQMKA
jgi:hypothetical protein